jgi:phosphoribosyl-AMP cyclohydrolase
MFKEKVKKMVEPDFEKMKGLVPVIVQDEDSREVLMMAYMNREAWLKTLETGQATFWSRSRNSLWVKGETSGNVQQVKEVLIDCDDDTVLLKVRQIGGAACHTGYRSCFYRRVSNGKVDVVGERIFNPEDVYK